MIGKDLVMATLFGSGGGSSGSGGGGNGSGSQIVKTGSVTFAERCELSYNPPDGYTLEHGLGVKPDVFLFGKFSYSNEKSLDTFLYRAKGVMGADGDISTVQVASAGSSGAYSSHTNSLKLNVTENEITVFNAGNMSGLHIPAKTYYWIAIGGLSE